MVVVCGGEGDCVLIVVDDIPLLFSVTVVIDVDGLEISLVSVGMNNLKKKYQLQYDGEKVSSLTAVTFNKLFPLDFQSSNQIGRTRQ